MFRRDRWFGELKKYLCKIKNCSIDLKLELLFKIFEPQSAYCAFTVGFKHEITYTMRVTSNIVKHITKREGFIQISLTPALVNGHLQENVEKKLLSLQVNSGKMGLVIFFIMANME